MKRKLAAIVAATLSAITVFAFTGCANGSKNILVVCREAASGTREAFDKYVGLTADELTSDKEEYSSTGNVREKVANTKTAIGYISLASVDDSVKALKVEGVEATEENVREGKYKIQRPFLLLTNKNVTLTAAAKDFFDYATSKTAEAAIIKEKGITTADFDTRKDYVVPADAISGTVILKGSTSMEDMIKYLVAEYKKLGGDKVSAVQFTFDFPGSSGGRTAVKEDTTGNVIGLASSAKADAAYTETTLCLDAVAVIVNKNNDKISDVNAQTLKDIYTGKIKKFEDIK
ncbi:MAG: substrate-binding domain-containing protein [Candidatus Borkfalkiaceae bacterium]|nr:substrate-binding domain-containing protein [Christensenellaceae bacterium]